MDFRDELAGKIAEFTGIKASELKTYLEVPPKSEMGDFALPCFRLAKTMHKSPLKIAEELSARFKTGNVDFVRETAAVNGYLNFYLKPEELAKALFEAINNKASQGFTNTYLQDQVITIDFSSPNIAKPFHVGHAFSTFLGDALANIYTICGAKVLRFNHLGDYGTQFGKLIVGWQLWGDSARLASDPIGELVRVYVKFHKEAQNNDELNAEARLHFRKLEMGETFEKELWSRFRSESLKSFEKIYERLGIKFDNANGESFYSNLIPAVVQKLKAAGLLTPSEGCEVVELEDLNLAPCMILKSDGSTTYASRDLAAIYYRYDNFHFDQNIYVVGIPQKNHFDQVFAVMRKLNFPEAQGLKHVAFGTVRFAEGHFSTREGNVILLSELLDEACAKTRAIIANNNPDMASSEVAAIAEKVGIGAVKYAFLKNGRERDIIFSWDEMLDFEGDTAPYLLYTVSRCRSLWQKADDAMRQSALKESAKNAERLTSADELSLLKLLNGITDAVKNAVDAAEPSSLAKHLIQIARSFNRFYHNLPILKSDDKEILAARLCLVHLTDKVLSCGLNLLGISPVEHM